MKWIDATQEPKICRSCLKQTVKEVFVKAHTCEHCGQENFWTVRRLIK
jgi:predicted RNA-binding Zn-ribbon protein involved in translation (DUF1610 family)